MGMRFFANNIKVKDREKFEEICKHILVEDLDPSWFSDGQDDEDDDGMEIRFGLNVDFYEETNTYSFGEHQCLIGYYTDEMMEIKRQVFLCENDITTNEEEISPEEFEELEKKLTEYEECCYNFMCDEFQKVIEDGTTFTIFESSEEKLRHIGGNVTVISSKGWETISLMEMEQLLIKKLLLK